MCPWCIIICTDFIPFPFLSLFIKFLKMNAKVIIHQKRIRNVVAIMHYIQQKKNTPLAIYQIIEGDALKVVHILWKTESCWSRYRQLINNVNTILKSLQLWYARDIKRETHKAIHHLDKVAIQQLSEHIRMKDYHIFLHGPQHCTCWASCFVTIFKWKSEILSKKKKLYDDIKN